MPIDLGGLLEQLTKRGSTTSSNQNTSSKRRPDLAGYFDKLVKQGKQQVGKVSTRRKPTSKQVHDRRQQRLPAEGVVAIEYSPRNDGDPDPGEVVWAWVPFEEDPTQGKDRPVVIIGRRADQLVGIPLTTQRNDREAQVTVGTGGWDPKRRISHARIWRMLDLDPSTMRREGSALPRERFDEVVAAVDEYYEVRQPSGAANSFDY